MLVEPLTTDSRGMSHPSLLNQSCPKFRPAISKHYSLSCSNDISKQPLSKPRHSSMPVQPMQQTSVLSAEPQSLAKETLTEEATRARRMTDSAVYSKHHSRSKTCFRLALPPPRTKQRLRLRPKLLLQVQQISGTTRPVPKLDVLPANFFGTLFGRRAHGLLNVRDSPFCAADVVVVPNDSYVNPAEDDDRAFDYRREEDASDQRELVAAITMPKKEESGKPGVGEVCLPRGSRWDATRLANGNYEFVSNSDGNRRVVRWVLRKGRRSTVTADGHQANEDQNSYTFSVIDPTTRRHPVLAWMSRAGVDIVDRYSPVSESKRRPSSSSADVFGVKDIEAGNLQRNRADKTYHEMDDFLRTLIVCTSIYVSLREGWARNEVSPNPDNIVLTSMAPLPKPSLSTRSAPVREISPEPVRVPKVTRRRSSQLSILFEKTSSVFRCPLSSSASTKSRHRSSMRHALESENASQFSSRRSSLSSGFIVNQNDVNFNHRLSAVPQRSATTKTARLPADKFPNRASSLLTDNSGDDSGGYETARADYTRDALAQANTTPPHTGSTTATNQFTPTSLEQRRPTPVPAMPTTLRDHKSHPKTSAFVKSEGLTPPASANIVSPAFYTRKWRKLGSWVDHVANRRSKVC